MKWPLRISSVGGLLFSFAFAGCSTGWRAIGDTVVYASNPDRQVESSKLNPSYDYLRVKANGRLSLLVLGSVEQLHWTSARVFYSGEAETLKLANGRILEYSGPGEGVRFEFPEPSPPEWAAVSKAKFARGYLHRPSYKYTKLEWIFIRRLSVPPKSRNLVGISPESLVWFEEFTSEHFSGPSKRFSSLAFFERLLGPQLADNRAIYGVKITDTEVAVVYSEQCITPNLCLTLQRWRAAGPY